MAWASKQVARGVGVLLVAASACACSSHSNDSSSSSSDGPPTPGVVVATPTIPHPAAPGTNRRRASAAAARALRNFPVPPGASRSAPRPDQGRYLDRLHVGTFPEDASLGGTRWWVVHLPYPRLVDWYAANTPADISQTSYVEGGKPLPDGTMYWQTKSSSAVHSAPVEVVSYSRLGPARTVVRADVTIAARSDRTAETLVPATATSMDITQHAIDGPGPYDKTVTVTDRSRVLAAVDAFNHVRGAYSPDGTACGSPDGIVHRYAVTFHWPGHTLAVDFGEPLCELGRRLTLDGRVLPETLDQGHPLVRALRDAFDAP